MDILELSPARLNEYARISISFEVRAVLQVDLLENGLGGMALRERAVPAYLKNYDLLNPPSSWPEQFDLTNWAIFMAMENGQALGGIVLARDTAGVDMLDGRADLAVLWDIRVAPEKRRQGLGARLIRQAVDWSRQHGCTQLKIETQNTNVTACRFYAAQGARLGDIRRFAYRTDPEVADEVQLNWYFDC